jgi:hypothetical protein
MQPAQLLRCRRVEDQPDNLWSTLSRVQPAARRPYPLGGEREAQPHAPNHFPPEDVRIIGRLWDVAAQVLAASTPTRGRAPWGDCVKTSHSRGKMPASLDAGISYASCAR